MVAGKCPPEEDELSEAEERGFDKLELYLETKHLDSFNKTLDNVKESGIDVVSVHTPHVPPFEHDYIKKADRLAKKLDAYLVFHTKYMQHTGIPKTEEIDIESEYGYENNPGNSVRHLEAMILEKGHNLVLDVAHLFMAEEDYIERTEYLLENYPSQIQVIHLCDSSLNLDGLEFGKGEMGMRKISETVYNKFSGSVVLEVMPEEQEDALNKWKMYTREKTVESVNPE